MQDSNLPYLTATQLLTALEQKQISAVELLNATVARIEKMNKEINALVTPDFERALTTAKAADAKRAKGEHLPLLGLPMTIKESFNIAGLPTTWANPEFKAWQPSQDALVVSRLKHAGAIILGKTNVPFMLQDWQTYNDLYGTTNNPHDLSCTSGGSSGGSAAALAAGFIPLELGSDLAGSLRAPAHFCGVYSHKPSQLVVPMRGSEPPLFPPRPLGSDLAVAGPMARSANDLSLSLNVLAGPDEIHEGKAYTLNLPAPRHKKLKDFRVVILTEHPLHKTESSISNAINELGESLAKRGSKITHYNDKMPSLVTTTEIYGFLLGAGISPNFPQEIYADFQQRVALLPSDDNSLLTRFYRSLVCSHRDWVLISRQREVIRAQFRELFKNYDLILSPVMPTVAFKHDHSDFETRQLIIDGEPSIYSEQYVWCSIATLCGLPATVAPIARNNQGLPIGVQIIGDFLDDLTTIEFAKCLEAEFGGFVAPSGM